MGLLSGYRIIESGMLLNAATLGMMLRDLGAEVIKVESPFLGDYLRAQPAHPINMHLQTNKGKRCVALDLRKPQGQEAMRRLVMSADAFVTNTVGAKNDKLGIGYEQLKAIKPDLVYCQSTGFGAEGPLADMPTHGQMMDAMAGAYPREMGPDGFVRPKMSEYGAGQSLTKGGEGTATASIYAAFHVAAGLAHRAKTGEGCYIDVSAADAVLASTWIAASTQANDPERVAAMRARGPATSVARYQFYETKDGRYVLFCPEEKKFWEPFCHLVGRPDLIPQIAGEDLRREVQAILHTRTQKEWIDLALKHSIPLGPAHSNFDEVMQDEHMRARQIIKPAHIPGIGDFTYIGTPAIVDHKPYEAPPPAPELGEDTDAVLAELGYSQAEIADLAKTFVTRAEVFQHNHIENVHEHS